MQPAADSASDRTPLPAVDLARLRWRCRRGMLENDLVLARYLDQRGGAITSGEAALLARLLDLPDNDLWDLFAGRAPAPDPSLAPLVERLRET